MVTTRPPTVRHLVVGRDQHGVVRHGLDIAHACGDRVIRLDRPDELDPAELTAADIVHVPYTDRLFAARAEDSATAFEVVAAAVAGAGAALSVTLHDLPAGPGPLAGRRRAAYQRVVVGARGIVVSSLRELELVAELEHTARSLRMIPLPVEPLSIDAAPGPTSPGQDVVVLGFLFPDRGYEAVIDALPPGVRLLALGRPAEGHDDLPGALIDRAQRAGRELAVTGFVPDDELADALRSAAVPVAPNRNVAASGSINSWIAAGRRPLVPDTAYTRELERRAPGTVTRYDADQLGALRTAIEQAGAHPESTWIEPGTPLGPDLAHTAERYRRHFAGCRPAVAIRVDADRWIVPDNRWDLLDGVEPGSPPMVSVVIPYFEVQAQLDLVLTALSEQTHPKTRLEVVVADDGSRSRPDLGAGTGLNTALVRQADQGFRAAAARNLGGRAAGGQVLLFLDADTVPEPDYVTRLVRLPALLPDALVVGRRRHADLRAWTPDRLRAWLSDGPGPAGSPSPLVGRRLSRQPGPARRGRPGPTAT